MRVQGHSETRQIHPRALAELGEEACIVALGVARDLRSGEISQYDQRYYCGTSCCIAGHIAMRLREHVLIFINRSEIQNSFALRFARYSLFGHSDAKSPLLAADAIHRYIFDGSETPWQA